MVGKIGPLAVAALILTSGPAAAVAVRVEADSPQAIDRFALRVAGSGTTLARTQRLVEWLGSALEWTATDYVQRTPEQILARGGGNCAELSKVLERLLKPAAIPYRWVAEINVHPESAERQANAEELIATRGARASVFGRHHNDHRWLEVRDDASGEWVPADPSAGLVGVQAWLATRVALGERRASPIPAANDVLGDMIVPIAVIAYGADGQRLDRSEHYLVRELNRFYGGRLETLPVWGDWAAEVREFAPLASRAFGGEVNLHDGGHVIRGLSSLYEHLRAQAANARLEPAFTPPGVPGGDPGE